MSDLRQSLSSLKELFPNYTEDLLLSVLETMGSVEASVEALFNLDSDPAPAAPTSLSADFLDVGGPADVTDEVTMQKQLEQIIRESREEVKGQKPESLSWKQKLKNVFKKKAKMAKPAAPPAPSVAARVSLPPPVVLSKEEEEDEEEEIISFKTAEDPRNIQGARYRQLPGKEDIELTAARKI